MRCHIDLLGEHYTVTVFGKAGEERLQVADGQPQSVALTVESEHGYFLQLGDQRAEIQMASKGETAYICAFDRTFTVRIVDPVEQAAQAAGDRSNTFRAPMPGMVVEVHVVAGEQVTKGQPMITIESMKILTVITAPRDGEVSRIHFGPGDTFDRSAALVSLTDKGERDAPHQVQH
jgi:3-methylcrotonyl-CoA carboxylase alpha subunit